MSGRLGCLGGDLNLFRVWSENSHVKWKPPWLSRTP